MRISLCHLATILLIATASGCTSDTAPVPGEPPPPVPAASLWIASGERPAIIGLTASQLLGDGALDVGTEITTTSSTLETLNGLAFDADGTLWVASAADSRLLGFSAEALRASGARVASTAIVPPERTLLSPFGLAFDRQERLWVASFGAGTLVRFDRSDLAAGGAVIPRVVIGGLDQPTAIAFDGGGSLWTTNSQAGTLVRYSPAQLETSGSPAPEVILGSRDGPLANPYALAFDTRGQLWVANLGRRTIVAFTPDQLRATGSPAPHIVISASAGSFDIPVGLAFDAAGSMWVVSGEGSVLEFAAEQLRESGAPRARRKLTLNGHALLSGLAFWPRPNGLLQN